MDFCPDLNFLCGLMSGGLLFPLSSLELPGYIWTSVINGQVYQTEMAGIELSNKKRSMHICDSAIHTFTHEYLHLCGTVEREKKVTVN